MAEALKKKIQENCNEFTAMMKEGKYEAAVEKFYTDDCHLLTHDGKALTGKKAVVEQLKEHDPKQDPWNMCIEEVNGEGDWCFMRGSFKAGKMSGKYLTVWKKVGGEFKIYNDMFSISA